MNVVIVQPTVTLYDLHVQMSVLVTGKLLNLAESGKWIKRVTSTIHTAVLQFVQGNHFVFTSISTSDNWTSRGKPVVSAHLRVRKTEMSAHIDMFGSLRLVALTSCSILTSWAWQPHATVLLFFLQCILVDYKPTLSLSIYTFWVCID